MSRPTDTLTFVFFDPEVRDLLRAVRAFSKHHKFSPQESVQRGRLAHIALMLEAALENASKNTTISR